MNLLKQSKWNLIFDFDEQTLGKFYNRTAIFAVENDALCHSFIFSKQQLSTVQRFKKYTVINIFCDT